MDKLLADEAFQNATYPQVKASISFCRKFPG